MPAPLSAFRRLPIRVRLTLAFAGVLAAVLAVGGVALYAVFANDFDAQIDHDLNTRLVDVTRLADAAARTSEDEPRRVPSASGDGLVQVYRADGRLLGSSRGIRGIRFLTPAQVRSAAGGRIRIARADTPVGETRVEAGRAAVAPLVVAVGELLKRRDHALDRLRQLLLIVFPLALLLATYAGYQVAGAALGPVERMRARAAQVTERDTSERLPVPETPRRDRGARAHPQRPAGAARLRARARAAAAVGRQPRAAHAPVGAAHRGRAGAARRPRRPRAARRARVRRAGGRAALAPCRRPARARPLRPGAIADPPRAARQRRAAPGRGGPRRRRRTAGPRGGRRPRVGGRRGPRPRGAGARQPGRQRAQARQGRRPAQRARPTAAACSCT